MRRLFSLVTFFALCSSLNAQLEITKVTDSIYVYTTYHELASGKFPSNSMYIVTSEGIVMIDTPWDETQLQPLLDTMQKMHQQQPVLCIATHWHDDRTNGLHYLDSIGVKTYSSSLTKQICQDEDAEEARYVFDQDTTFILGDFIIHTYFPGVGHSMDNQLIYLPQIDLLYGGCFIKSHEAKSIGYTVDGSVYEWKKSLKVVSKKFKNSAFVITGHEDWNNPKGNFRRTKQLVNKSLREARRQWRRTNVTF